MKKSFQWLILLTCLLTCPAAAQTVVEGGVVSGTWTKAGSPYLINGTVSIPVESVLVIDPGVEVNFSGHYKFEIHGQLLAEGISSDSIVFTATDRKTGWHGLRFLNTISNDQDTSRLSFCRLEYGRVMGDCPDNRGGAVYAELARLTVSHCLIRRNIAVSGAADWGGGAIYCDKSNVIITDNTITQNHSGHDGGGIYCSFSSPQIHRNIITDNEAAFRGGGIASFTLSAPDICHNTIRNNRSDNHGGGMYISGGNPLIQHNIIEANQSALGGGIDCYLSNALIINNLISSNSAGAGGALFITGCSPVITSNTICQNQATLYGGGLASTFEFVGIPVYSAPVLTANIIYENMADDGSQLWSAAGCVPVVAYCDVQEMSGAGISGEYTAVAGNIDLPPLFSDVGLNAWELTSLSPCIDTGPSDLTGTFCPDCDLGGCVRVWDGNGDQTAVVDMGAWEYGSPALGIEEAEPAETKVFGCKIYPNPAGGKVTFGIQVPDPGKAEIRLTLPDGRILNWLSVYLAEDDNDVFIDLSRLRPGVYIYEVYYMGHKKSGHIVHF